MDKSDQRTAYLVRAGDLEWKAAHADDQVAKALYLTMASGYRFLADTPPGQVQ